MINNNASTTPPQHAVPTGYCPHCDYALMAPGVCPECGVDVPADRMRAPRRWSRVRNAVRRARKPVLTLIIIVSLISAANWAFETGQFYRLYSSETLLARYPSNRQESAEIARRVMNNAFTAKEIQTRIAKSFTVKLSVDSPYPKNTPVNFTYTADMRRGTLFFLRSSPIVTAQVDGKACKLPFGTTSSNFFGAAVDRLRHEVGDWQTDVILSHGAHRLDVTWNFEIKFFDPRLDSHLPPPAATGVPITRSCNFRIAE
ncbi:MAG TPA: hypothetical protein P5081_11195 [Phycisphaerae bacterium]|nr:hypothetical protein [Phycisphaerae bacterium]HRW53445.1 hypothetical protein [Phycisphaerae bacterium]